MTPQPYQHVVEKYEEEGRAMPHLEARLDQRDALIELLAVMLIVVTIGLLAYVGWM